jgi:hypothetical protein
MPDTSRQTTYEPPAFEVLGTMAALTQSGSGNVKDSGKGSQVAITS